MSLSKRDQEVIWHPYTKSSAQPPIGIVRGEGALVYDENGRAYIDAISSWWVNLHGHAHPHIAQKVSAQLSQLEHVIFAGFTHQPAVELAEMLLKILPGEQARVFYSDNGSTAVEVALKIAIQYWQNRGFKKNKIVAFSESYHGDTFGAMSVSARGAFTEPFSSFLFEVIHLPYPQKGKEAETISALKKAISGDEQLAAFIFEPLILGSSGMHMYGEAVLDELLAICRRNNILTIADEVMTGFGRTGKNFACEHLSEKPDMICLSKGLTGGTMALGVTTCNRNIFDQFSQKEHPVTFFHGHSYTANPVACAAGLASGDLLLAEECQSAINRISAKQEAFAAKLRNVHGINNARSRGTIMAVDFETGSQNSYFHPVRDLLYSEFLDAGIILRPLGNTVYILPPYCITDQQLDHIYEVIEEKIRKYCVAN